jgi:methyl acetate hydrolase
MEPITRRGFARLAVALAAPAVKQFGAVTSADDVLRAAVDQKKVPAVVAIAGTSSGIDYTGAFGKRDSASTLAVSPESIFSIASMTKAVTSVAAMQLVEQGKMALDQPASRYLPELGVLQVLDGFDNSGKPMLRPPRKPVTLRQLLSHTSGFAYDTWHEAMFKFTSSGGDATHVLAFEPGSKWQYGPSTFWAGRLVEAVSGQPLEDYMQRNILQPLGMKDTSFILAKEKFDRLVSRYQRQPDGSLVENARTQPSPPQVYRGDGGLFSTAADYMKFVQMILRKGAGPGGERILQAKNVARISANATGHLAAGRLKSMRPAQSSDVDFHPGHDDRYTLAFLMNPEAYPGARSAGSLGWAGINNTYYWIDPRRGIGGVIMMHLLPFADTVAVSVLSGFERAVYASRT